jgi:hypothetical protein
MWAAIGGADIARKLSQKSKLYVNEESTAVAEYRLTPESRASCSFQWRSASACRRKRLRVDKVPRPVNGKLNRNSCRWTQPCHRGRLCARRCAGRLEIIDVKP